MKTDYDFNRTNVEGFTDDSPCDEYDWRQDAPRCEFCQVENAPPSVRYCDECEQFLADGEDNPCDECAAAARKNVHKSHLEPADEAETEANQ